jgi:hypothetical protein
MTSRSMYEKPIRALMRDMVKEFGLQPGQIISSDQVVNWYSKHYEKLKSSSIKAHLVMMSTNDKNRIHYTDKPENDLFFKIGTGQFRLYEPNKDPAPIRKTTPVDESDSKSENGGEEDYDDQGGFGTDREFAYERDLQSYLAKNLDQIEPGLTLYEDELSSGVEYPAGRRRIDILAQDKNGSLVIIELKVARSYDRVVGQILNYVSWVKENLAEPDQRVRGIIIGRKITEDLQLACLFISDLTLMEYELSVTLKTVSTESKRMKN